MTEEFRSGPEANIEDRVETGIRERDARFEKHLLGVPKPQPVFGESGCTFQSGRDDHSKMGISFASTSSTITSGTVSSFLAPRAAKSSTRG